MHTPHARLHAAIIGYPTTEQVIAEHQATPPRPMPWEVIAEGAAPPLPARAYAQMAEAFNMDLTDVPPEAHGRLHAALTRAADRPAPAPPGAAPTPERMRPRTLDELRHDPTLSPGGRLLIEAACAAKSRDGGTR